MIGKTHRLGGLTVGLAVPLVCHFADTDFSLLETFSFTTGAALGSLIPDIDHQGSMIGQKVKPLSILIRKTCGHRGVTHWLITLIAYGLVTFLLSEGVLNALQRKHSSNLIALFVGCILGLATTFILTILKRFVKKKFLPKKKILLFGIIAFVLGCFTTKVFPKFVSIQIQALLIGSIFGYADHLYLDAYNVSGIALFQPFSSWVLHLGHVRTGSNWNNHKPNDTEEDRKKAKGLGEEFVFKLHAFLFSFLLVVTLILKGGFYFEFLSELI